MRWGERKLQENFEKDALFYKWTQNDRKKKKKKKTEKYEFCITVRGTFVHIVGLKSGPEIRKCMLEKLALYASFKFPPWLSSFVI